MKNLAIFVSGNGTNCENIIRYFADNADISIALVLSNRSDAYALTRARRLGVPTEVLTKADFNRPDQLLPLLKRYEIDFIVLAGFLLMAPPFLVEAYAGRMINIHPALLPKYGGRGMYGHHVHEAVHRAHETESGITIHWVSNECDGGQTIAQFSTPLTPEDTPERIAAKVHVLEMKHFPEVIEQVVSQI